MMLERYEKLGMHVAWAGLWKKVDKVAGQLAGLASITLAHDGKEKRLAETAGEGTSVEQT